MGSYRLKYRAAERRALKSQPLTYKPVVNSGVVAKNTASTKTWQPATYTGFNAESGKYQVKTWSGVVAEADRIPGYGAEFGGVSTGSNGLLSQGFWSN